VRRRAWLHAVGVSAPVEIHVLDKNVYGRTRTCTDVYVARALCEQGFSLLRVIMVRSVAAIVVVVVIICCNDDHHSHIINNNTKGAISDHLQSC